MARSVDRVLRAELKSFALRRVLSRNLRRNRSAWSKKKILCVVLAAYCVMAFLEHSASIWSRNQAHQESLQRGVAVQESVAARQKARSALGAKQAALASKKPVKGVIESESREHPEVSVWSRLSSGWIGICKSFGVWLMDGRNIVQLVILCPICFLLAKKTFLFWGDYEFALFRVQQENGKERYPFDVVVSPALEVNKGKHWLEVCFASACTPGISAQKLALLSFGVCVSLVWSPIPVSLGGLVFYFVRLRYLRKYPAMFDTTSLGGINEISLGSVLAAVRHKRTGARAVIHLKQEGPLSVTTFGVNGEYQPGVLPPISKKVHDIAYRFNGACDVFIKYRESLEAMHKQGRPLSWANAPVQAANRQTTKQHAQPTVLSVAEKKARAKKIWADLILDEKVKDELIELALHFDSGSLAASKGLLLYGPPGTGKTLIARKLSETMGAEFFPVTVADLKGPHIGQTAERTKAIWEKALAAPKAVLFVDECEGAFGARGSAGVDQFAEELVQTFISQWDGFSKQRNVWVVGATNLRDKIDAAVLSRFGEEVQIPLPGSRERVKIFQQELAKKGIRGPLPAETEELTQGFSGRDLENIAGRIARKCEAAGGVTLEILEAVTRNKRAQGSTASDGNATWDRLVLPEQTLQTLKNTAELFKHAEEFEKIHISMPRGILLYGPPGTGKTQIARTLAKESGLQFIAATTGDLKANYIGQSANKVKMLFERARNHAPCILFIDELDIVAPGRGSRNNDSFTQEIVGQLLQELDGVKSVAGQIFLLGATNLLESIDSAIRSRFPTHIEIPPPDEEGIAALLRVFLGKKPIDFDLEPASRIMAKGMAGFSGRDIRSIVERAEQAAVGRAIKAGNPQSAKITLVDLRAAMPTA